MWIKPFLGTGEGRVYVRSYIPVSHNACAAPKSRVFAQFWSENRYRLCPFGLELGMVFEGTTECMNVFIVSIPNE